jgi:hypothetical protein
MQKRLVGGVVGGADVMNKFYAFNDKFHAYGNFASQKTWFSHVHKEL